MISPSEKERLKNGPMDPSFPKSGAIVVDKPAGMTTNDVVYQVRKALSLGFRLPWGFKIGHGGTLDPFATGLTVIFFGEATKLATAYLRSFKGYSGRIQLGVRTDTADHTGTITEQKPVPATTLDQWNAIAQSFVHQTYWQTPPMYSAKKIKGMALHHLARQGIEVARDSIQKKIFRFEIRATERSDQLDFYVECESGTYVRTLAEDLAHQAGTTSHLLSLRRERSSDLSLTEAPALNLASKLLAETTPTSELNFVLPISKLGSHLPSIAVNTQQESQIRRGLSNLTQKLIQSIPQNPLNADSGFGLIRAEDGFPIALIENEKLQRVLNR